MGFNQLCDSLWDLETVKGLQRNKKSLPSGRSKCRCVSARSLSVCWKLATSANPETLSQELWPGRRRSSSHSSVGCCFPSALFKSAQNKNHALTLVQLMKRVFDS